MICPRCGTEMNGDECPECGFPWTCRVRNDKLELVQQMLKIGRSADEGWRN